MQCGWHTTRQLFWLLVLWVSVGSAPHRSSLVTHGEFTIDGSILAHASALSDALFENTGRTMLTLNTKTTGIPHAKIECLLDVYRLYGLYQDMAATIGDSILSGADVPVMADLRMFYGALYLPWADVTIGRQIVNLGKGMLFSPLDCFSTVDVTELAFRRSGSDIAMAAIPIGSLSGVDLVTTLPRGEEQTSALRVFTTLFDWDASATALYRSRAEQFVGGLAFKGDYHLGITGELVTRYNHLTGDLNGEAMAGIDYSLQQTWFMNTEYYYRTDSSPHLLYHTHNLFGSLRYVINDLMNLSLSGITSVPSRSRLATLQFSWNILQSVNTITFLRYAHFTHDAQVTLPDTEAGIRIVISF